MGLVDKNRAIRSVRLCDRAELLEVKAYIEDLLGPEKTDVISFDQYVWKMRCTVPGMDVTEAKRTRLTSWCRFIVIYKMLSDGYSIPYVAQCFGMTVSGVKYAKRSMDKMLESPKFYPDEYRIYCLYISNFAEYEKDLGKD